MNLYSLLIENKNILELLYVLVISIICAVVVIKTDRFFRLSLHQGIRYFRNAFFFYGIAFVARHIFGILSDINYDSVYIAQIIFEYFIIMAGFFLFYSLIWKRFESPKGEYISSLFNARIAIFHLMAVILAVLDHLWQNYHFMFLSQIVIFCFASVVSYINYRKNGTKHKFPKFYLLAMILGLAVWVLNFLAESYFKWDYAILIIMSMINVIFFLLLLYGVIKVTKIK